MNKYETIISEIHESLSEYTKGLMLFNDHTILCKFNERLAQKGLPPWVVDVKVEVIGHTIPIKVKLRDTRAKWKQLEHVMTNGRR